MISVAQAQEAIRQRARPLAVEAVPLGEVHGRTLREAVYAPEDVPSFDRSAMDGYAVRADDEVEEWQVIGEIRAGQIVDAELCGGEAMRIFTGARLPGPGLKVIMQEDVAAESSRIRLKRKSAGSHVRHRGEDARAGEILLEPGLRLNAAAVALLASAGKTSVPVSRVPRILHLTTGDEIVPPGQTPGPGQIRNSNAFLISALVREWGGEATHLHAPDQLETMIDLLAGAQPEARDLILVSGGSGAGSYDFTAKLFESLGAEIYFRQVDVRPGKPLIFGGTPAQLVFGLPGNALSHFVCFHLFVRVALAGLLGRTPGMISSAIVAEPVTETLNSRETWWPVRTIFRDGRVEVRALPWKSSGDITRLPGADALIRVPAQTPLLPAGASVDYLSLRADI
jgi:molybdopterin molybdotransferase